MDRITLRTGKKAVILPFSRRYNSGAIRSSVVYGEDIVDCYATMTVSDRRELANDCRACAS